MGITVNEQGCQQIMKEINIILSQPFFPESEWELIYALDLPFPPTTGNHRLGIRKKSKKEKNFYIKPESKKEKRFYLKPTVKKYYNDIAILTSPLRKGNILDTELGTFVYWLFPNNCKRDVDNLTKILFDALQYAEIVKDDFMLSKRTASVFASTVDKERACAFVLIFKKRKQL